MFAPPFASAMDIVNSAANALENTIEGRHQPVDVEDFLKAFNERHATVLDVRSAAQAEPFIKKYGDQWHNIPQEELERAIMLFGAADNLREKINIHMQPHERDEYDRQVSDLHSLMNEHLFQTFWGRGRAMTMDEAVELAVSNY